MIIINYSALEVELKLTLKCRIETGVH